MYCFIHDNAHLMNTVFFKFYLSINLFFIIFVTYNKKSICAILDKSNGNGISIFISLQSMHNKDFNLFT